MVSSKSFQPNERASKNQKEVFPQQHETPKVAMIKIEERSLSEKNCVWLLPNGVNLNQTAHRKHTKVLKLYIVKLLPTWTRKDRNCSDF